MNFKNILLAAALIFSLGTNLSAKRNVRLLYWNVQNGMWDGQTDDYQRFTDWVKAQQPDVCVWCEAVKLYVTNTADREVETEEECLKRWERLAARYGHKYIYLSAHPDNFPQLITSRFPFEPVKLIKGNEDTIVCHGASWYTTKIGRKKINLVSLHTWPQAYGFNIPKEKREQSARERGGDTFRRAEMEYICRQTILSHKKADKELWAMMGDFNSVSRVDNTKYQYDEENSRFLVHDYIRQQTPYVDLIKTFYPDSVVSSTGGGSRIDFMYLTPALNEKVIRAGIAKDKYTTPRRNEQKISNFWHPSDHLPILVDFRL